MNYYLIEFDYDGWCQGPETMHKTVLVQAMSSEIAEEKIRGTYENARYLENNTLEQSDE